MHWLPVYLCPFTLVWSLRRSSPIWIHSWITGALAFVVPGVVDFGPVHEHEYLRWEFCAALAMSIPLGGAAGQLMGRRLWLWSFYAWFALSPGLRQHWDLAHIAYNDGPAKTFLFLTSDRDWLLRHRAQLRLSESDFVAMAALKDHSTSGEFVLVNFSPDDPWGTLFESTLLQRTELESIGHALPAPTDAIAVPPSRQTRWTTQLLHDPSPEYLRAVGCDWIYTRSAPQDWCTKLEAIPGVTKLGQYGQVRVHHIELRSQIPKQ
jgi:hypothetical protein